MRPALLILSLCNVLLLNSCSDTDSGNGSGDAEPYSGADHESIASYFGGVQPGSHYFYFPDDGTVFILNRSSGEYDWTDSEGLSGFLSRSGSELKGWIVYTTVYDSFETPEDFGILHNYLMKNRYSTQSLPNDPHPLATKTRAQHDGGLKGLQP